jgi:SAM-dependent methyltransferase
MSFKDYFSGHAKAYAQFRPHYPKELFTWLAGQTVHHDQAWDCGCGNGQAAVELAAYYQAVFATDPSAEQIAHATPQERVTYRVEPAESTSLPDTSMDLITVAQALHWFDTAAFYREVQRVLRNEGLLAVWGYGPNRVMPEVDAILYRLYHDIVGPYWPAERRHIEARYQSLPFPYPEMPVPEFDMTHAWDLEQLVGYLQGWSAAKQYEKKIGRNPIDEIFPELLQAWGLPETRRTVRWPLFLRVGRKEGHR